MSEPRPSAPPTVRPRLGGRLGALAARLSARGAQVQEAPAAPDPGGPMPVVDENPMRAVEEAVERALRAHGYLR